MINPLLGSFSSSFFAWWLFFVLSPPQAGGPPSEQGHPTDDSISRQAQEPGETILYFPDYVDGGGWSVQLVLSNVDPDAAAEVLVEVYDPDGQPILDLFNSDLTLEIPALGSRVLRSTGSGAIRRGWIQAETDADTISGLLAYRNAQSGIEVGVKPVELGPQFALFVEESPTVGAGVAVYKPDASSRLELRIRDEDGSDPLEGGFVPWGDFHQSALTLPEWFAVEGVDTGFLTDFRGLLFLETEDESEFAPLGLRFGKRTSSLSAVPAIRTQSEEPQETLLVFPDYVDGGGWSVQLALTNVDPDAAVEVRVEVYDPDGQPVLDLFDSDLTFEIPSQGSRVLKSAGSGAIRRGWIQVGTDAPTISGLLTYRHSQSGIEVGVEPARLGKQFALFVEESGTVGAGLALFKPDAESRIDLRIRDEEGNDPLNGVFLPWRDFHQAARTLPEWFDVHGVDAGFLADFRGLLFLRTEDESPFAPLGLRFGKETSSLSAVPAIGIPDGGGIDDGRAPPPTVTLSASPKSIDRGQSTTLTWSSTNAENAEITPDIGRVPTSGSRTVSPSVTTTYRITVTGADGQTAPAAVTVTVAVSERAALVALYEALGGSMWTHSENWLTDAPLGEWYGVEVDIQGRVIGLQLFTVIETEEGHRIKIGIGLTGVLPPELGSLFHLRVLDLSENQVEGPIPPELGALGQLEFLSLGGNNLTGEIPAELGALAQLKTLYLRLNQLTGAIPPELGALAELRTLNLGENQLTGEIPVELGALAQLELLSLAGNQLAGEIPPSFLNLDQLNNFNFHDLRAAGLCVPGTSDFVTWLQGMERYNGSYCNESDGAVLDYLYRSTGGEDWTNSDGWVEDGALGERYGVQTDSLGRVTGLDLSGNGLAGRFPGSLLRLGQLTELRVDGNALSGRLPWSLTRLSLQEFHYANSDLCVPNEASFRSWLDTIPSHEGTGMTCGPPSSRDFLMALYDMTDGPNWAQDDQWGAPAPLKDWHGVRVDESGQVTALILGWNRLEGEIPAALLSLSKLRHLNLSGNNLTGEIQVELSRLSNLEVLYLDGNELTGSVPPELGQMRTLKTLGLTNNTRLSGDLPASLTSLSRLEAFLAGGTDLCAPADARFRNWLDGVWKRQIVPCSRDGLPKAYLTQAVQSQEFPVPLVAGEKALLRVFVTSERDTDVTLPPVQATFYRDGAPPHVVNIPGKSASIPNEVEEGDLTDSVNAEIPDWVIQPGLEMVVDIDPQGTLDSSLGVTKRIPESGRLAVEVQMMPDFHLTVIPLLWRQNPDSSTVDMAKAMEQDPESHELLQDTRTLLPISKLEVTAHAPVLTSTNNTAELELELRVIRAMEGSSRYYLGMITGAFDGIAGRASLPGWTAVTTPNSEVIAHELGHNLNLRHALCGGTPNADPSFPDTYGSIGTWGYDFREGGRLVPPQWRDLMVYCDVKWITNYHFTKWIGDYHFTNALRYRLQTATRSELSSLVAAPANALMLWGGVDSAGVPFLEPAFVVDAPASLPRSTGDYKITGRTSAGGELFSLSFDMPELADEDRRSSFAFVLPAKPEWAEQLASIALSGPHSWVTLDKNTDRPVTLLRDPKSGQIRGILRDAAPDALTRDNAASALSLDPGLEMLTSQGIPDPDDWGL